MPFCGKCGRKLMDGERCNCDRENTPSAAEPAEEFFSSVGKAIDEAEHHPAADYDEDIKIRLPKRAIDAGLRQKIDDASRFDETRPFSIGGSDWEESPIESEDASFFRRIGGKRLALLSAGGILLAAALFLCGYLLFSPKQKETGDLPVLITMADGTDLVISKAGGKDRKVTVPGDTAFYENQVTFTENGDRVFFFADGGKSLYYLDLAGKNWYKNQPVLIDSGFSSGRYFIAPDGKRLLCQKSENGPLLAIGLERGERVELASFAKELLIDESFTYLTFVSEENLLYEVRLDSGWQTVFVAELSENAVVFQSGGKVWYLVENALYCKANGVPYQLVAEEVSELAYENADGISCLWSRENGTVLAADESDVPLDDSFYYTAAAASYYPLVDFIQEENWEELRSLPVAIGEITDLRWELKEENRYLIVTSMSSTDVQLQYAYFDEAEGAYVVTQQQGHFSTPETIAVTVSEEEGKQSYEYQIYFKYANGKSSLVISGEADSLVVRGEYLLADSDRFAPPGGVSWQKEFVDSLDGKSYLAENKALYYCADGAVSLVKDGCEQISRWENGVLQFSAENISRLPQLSLSEISPISLTDFMEWVKEQLQSNQSTEPLIAPGGAVYPGADSRLSDGELSFRNGSLYLYAPAEETLFSVVGSAESLQLFEMASDVSPGEYYAGGSDVVFFRNAGFETGSLFYNGARVSDEVYLGSCVWSDPADLSRFFYIKSSGSGKQLWYYADTVSTLACENIAGLPIIAGETAVCLSELHSGVGDVILFADGAAQKIGEASGLVAFR